MAAQSWHARGFPAQYAAPDQPLASDPHLFLRLIDLSFRLFGVSEGAARAVGVFSSLLAIFLVYRLVRENTSTFDPSARWAGLTALLYALTPLTIQGSAILMIDNTILVPALLWLFLCAQRMLKPLTTPPTQPSPTRGEGEKGMRILSTALAMCLALWCRLLTPLLALIFLVAYSFMLPVTRSQRFQLWAALGGGFALFLGTWWGYGTAVGLSPADPFHYLVAQLRLHAPAMGGWRLTEILNALIVFVLWLTPFTVLVLAGAILETIRHRTWFRSPEALPLIGGLCLAVGYLLMGGEAFGFPKFESPSIALLFAGSGIVLSRTMTRVHFPPLRSLLGLALCLGLAFFILCGDPLLTYRWTLRTAALEGTLRAATTVAAIRAAVAIALAGGLYALWRIRYSSSPLLLFLIAGAFGTAVCQNAIQSMVSYHTGYNYGAIGVRETASFLKDTLTTGRRVIAPSEIVYLLNPPIAELTAPGAPEALSRPDTPYVSDRLWNDGDRLARELDHPDVQGLAFSLPTNPISQVKFLTADPRLLTLLQNRFTPKRIGSFYIWMKKGG